MTVITMCILTFLAFNIPFLSMFRFALAFARSWR